jgi:hypothetical protein
MKNLSMFITALVVAVPAFAADPLPKPVADMECLIGNWKGGGTLSMGKDRAKLDATWTCQRTSAQFGVLCNFHVTGIPGVNAYDETDLMGYEPNSNLYHWYSVTNAGETHDHVAKVPEGNTIQFIYTGIQEGKTYKEVIDLAFTNDSKAVTGRAQTFIAGASTSIMDIKLRK